MTMWQHGVKAWLCIFVELEQEKHLQQFPPLGSLSTQPSNAQTIESNSTTRTDQTLKITKKLGGTKNKEKIQVSGQIL